VVHKSLSTTVNSEKTNVLKNNKTYNNLLVDKQYNYVSCAISIKCKEHEWN
jgi:hypothetical protein